MIIYLFFINSHENYIFVHRTYTQSGILTLLKPFTQYAYYVKTYTISTERSGAQSKLQYFKTLPGQPSIVRALTIYSNASDTLVISWLPPHEPNSNLTHYEITGQMERYDLTFLRQRNYCIEREYIFYIFLSTSLAYSYQLHCFTKQTKN